MTGSGRRPSEVMAEAIAAIKDGRACMTWQLWGQPLLRTDRGRWALNVLSGFFGPDFLHTPSGRPSVSLFEEALNPVLGAHHIERVVELTARIASIAECSGAGVLAAEPRSNPQPETFAHLRALLALAAPLASDGWTLDLDPTNPSIDGGVAQAPKPDLRARRDGVEFAVEVKRLGFDQYLRLSQEFTDKVRLLKFELESLTGRGLDVECEWSCDDRALAAWRADVLTTADDGRTAVAGPGSGRTTILDTDISGTLTGPVLRNDLWPRIAGTIGQATRQLARDHRGWVLLQDDGSTAWATNWSQQSIEDKLHVLSRNIRAEIAGGPPAGVVMTTGARNGTAVPQDVPGPASMAVRRSFVGRRARETFIVCAAALHGPGRGFNSWLPTADAQALYHAYAQEGDWLDHHLPMLMPGRPE